MTRKPSVLHVVAQYPPVYGGAGAQAAALSRFLHERGWRITTVTLDQDGVGSSRDRSGRVTRVPCPRGDSRMATASRSLLLGLAACMLVLFKRPTVVHIHGAYWWSILPAWGSRLVRARVLVKVTRDGEDDPMTCLSKRAFGVPLGRLYSSTFRSADRVVVLNDLSERSCAAAGFGDKVFRITNGVDQTRFIRSEESRSSSRQRFGLAEDIPAVLFVGYLVRHKGVLDLLAAWKRVTDLDARLFLVGPADGFYRELDDDTISRVKDAAANDSRIVLAGKQSGEALLEYYRAADLFVLPSYQEGMPNSLLEALVMGLPAIGGDIPGIQELRRDQLWLTEPGDVDGLAALLRRHLTVSTNVEQKSEDLWMSSVGLRYERAYRGQE